MNAGLRIVADRVIAQAQTAFSACGSVTSVDGRQLNATLLRTADILLVRSVTRVDRQLLAGTAVRFVGTATAGTDHIDLDYLKSQGIGFAAAAGCNARAVGEYVLACVLALALQTHRPLREMRCAIVGCGHAGRAVEALLTALEVHCLRYDPPRAEREGTAGFVGLDEALRADIVTLHVPLTRSGEHPTLGLLGRAELAALQPGALLINAARGGVVDETALRAWIGSGRWLAAIDCWQNEPQINADLLRCAWVATPHIAGHTLDARQRATQQLRAALLAWLVIPDDANGLAALPPLSALNVADKSGLDALCAAVFHCCNPLADTPRLRALAGADTTTTAAPFDALRAQAGARREFTGQSVAIHQGDSDTAALLQRLDFPLVSA